MSGPDDPDDVLLLPFDSDSPEFRRGVETGILWAQVSRDGHASGTVHADCAEMVMRIAEAKGVAFSASPAGEDFLVVTIGGTP